MTLANYLFWRSPALINWTALIFTQYIQQIQIYSCVCAIDGNKKYLPN
ncbi:hypothetical protein [Chroococcidiopsis sp. CCNUC1]|nr:hypothetical protein [Chroococcidiopsis sp. CCNUC1]URD47713.1 hypothetical protein M5J74_15360 [Chroococcidiopsis sp. CCNUC1]